MDPAKLGGLGSLRLLAVFVEYDQEMCPTQPYLPNLPIGRYKQLHDPVTTAGPITKGLEMMHYVS